MSKINPQVKGYMWMFFRESTVNTLMVSSPITLLLVLVAVFNHNKAIDIIACFWPTYLSIILMVFYALRTVSFAAMIRKQEEKLGVSFPTEPLKPFYKKTFFHSSGDWIIKAGCWAYHRANLKKITVSVVNEGSTARGYVANFYTLDGEKKGHRVQSGEGKKLREWYSTGC